MGEHPNSMRKAMPKKGDKAKAYFTLCMHRSLSSAAKAVGACLVNAFNQVTGQCDVGVGSISRRTGLSRRAVFRALANLVEQGLVSRTTHGGKSHRNDYAITWDRMQWCQNWHLKGAGSGTLDGAGSGTQTLKGTLKEKPETCSAGIRPSGRQVHRSQSALLLPIDGGRKSTIARADAARSQAEARIDADLRNQLGDRYPIAVELITRDLASAATEAETQQRGRGVALILSALGWHDSPPVLRSAAS